VREGRWAQRRCQQHALARVREGAGRGEGDPIALGRITRIREVGEAALGDQDLIETV
jgi:hypothetical protein